MTTVTLPEPPVAADVDLRDFPFIPFEVQRIRRSKAWRMARRRPEIGFYMANLWMASWHEMPAGSLEDDDEALADAAMCDPKKWAKVKPLAMHGWYKCSDGRLYHDVVAEKAQDAWDGKRKNRKRTAAATKARKSKKINGGSDRNDDVDDVRDENRNDHRDEVRGAPVTSTKGQGEGQGERRESLSPPSPPSLVTASAPGPTSPAGGDPEGLTAPKPVEDLKALNLRANEVRIDLMQICGTDENRSIAWAKISAIVGWLQGGADPDLDILPTFRVEAERRRAKNLDPIGSPSYLTEAVMRAKNERIASQSAGAQPKADGAAPTAAETVVDPEAELWRGRMTGLRDRGFWLDSFGPLVGVRGCQVPQAILIEFGVTDRASIATFLLRHRGAA